MTAALLLVAAIVMFQYARLAPSPDIKRTLPSLRLDASIGLGSAGIFAYVVIRLLVGGAW